MFMWHDLCIQLIWFFFTQLLNHNWHPFEGVAETGWQTVIWELQESYQSGRLQNISGPIHSLDCDKTKHYRLFTAFWGGESGSYAWKRQWYPTMMLDSLSTDVKYGLSNIGFNFMPIINIQNRCLFHIIPVRTQTWVFVQKWKSIRYHC